MEKLVLKDETKIEVTGVDEYSFITKCTPEEMVKIYDSLSSRNLARYELQNEDGDVMAVFQDKDVVSCKYENDQAVFILRAVDVIERRIIELEDAFAEVNDVLFELFMSMGDEDDTDNVEEESDKTDEKVDEKANEDTTVDEDSEKVEDVDTIDTTETTEDTENTETDIDKKEDVKDETIESED